MHFYAKKEYLFKIIIAKIASLKYFPYSLELSFFPGAPSPRLSWWREHALIDDSYEVINGDTTNTLRIPSAKANDLNAVYTCQANNNNQSIPVSTSLRMDMTCK